MTVDLIIDTDPGIDDAMAYFYAHASTDINIVALTTVFGNATIDDATKNALWLTQLSNSSISVYAGASVPLQIQPKAPTSDVHGDHGLGNNVVGQLDRSSESENAVDYLTRIVDQHNGDLNLCALGPLTNVAMALDKDPEFVSKLKQLVIMGGSLRAGGNVTDHAEANFWHDPHAANVVLNAQQQDKIIIVGLDVTNKIKAGPDSFETLAKQSRYAGKFLQEVGDYYLDFYERNTGTRMCSLHDPAALIACVKSELFSMEKHQLSVVTSGDQIGKMVTSTANGGGYECLVCTDVEAISVKTEFERVVAQND